MTDLEHVPASPETSEAEEVSRLKRYDKRVEEWLASLKEGAEERSPEVLSSLAAKAKDVGNYLDKLAEQARTKRAAGTAGSATPIDASSETDHTAD
jgi:hypothetical protein